MCLSPKMCALLEENQLLLFSFISASDCMALYQNGQTTSGVYSIHPKEVSRTDVVCDMETMGGGWTVNLSRQSKLKKETNGDLIFFY